MSSGSQLGQIQLDNSEKGGRATSFTVKPLNQSPSASANHAAMMMTGMSHFSPTNKMMQAKTQLKMMETQKNVVQNRIQKLSKEEEMAQKRIRDLERQASFLQRINTIKDEKHRLKQQFISEVQQKEQFNRDRANFNRTMTRMNIQNNRQAHFRNNKCMRSELKHMSTKIKETIQANRAKMQAEKEQNFRDIYNLKTKARKDRSLNMDRSNVNIAMNYTMRINDTLKFSDDVGKVTKVLEVEEQNLLNKLQQTYNKEKLAKDKLRLL